MVAEYILGCQVVADTDQVAGFADESDPEMIVFVGFHLHNVQEQAAGVDTSHLCERCTFHRK